jgi:NAD-dependent SIR2 family protein deacetylase
MGVDSGLPDFRGNEGFWRAYPPFRKLGLSFVDLANPAWFESEPALAWGFYGHRLHLYRRTRPHAGFDILLRWSRAAPDGFFVFTSNVDGHFQRAGFDPERVHECHGAIDWMQCTRECGAGIFSAERLAPDVDESTFRARPPLPACPRCGALARPNILMFGDSGWDSSRSDEQARRLEAWLASLPSGAPADRAAIVVVECGAGAAVPTVRLFSERLVRWKGAALVRINVREADVPAGEVGLTLGALAALSAIDERIETGAGSRALARASFRP